MCILVQSLPRKGVSLVTSFCNPTAPRNRCCRPHSRTDQALLRPHTPHTGPRQDLAANPMPTVRMGSRWSQAWRRVAGPPLVRGSGQPRTPTQAATLSLSGEAGVAGLFPTVCFSFKSTTNRTPTCFLNKAGITSLRKACQTHKAYDVCVPTRVI